MDVKNRLVAQLNVDKNLLVVDKVKPNFGEGRADGYAKLYDSEEKLVEIEKQHVLEKNKEAAEEAEEEEE